MGKPYQKANKLAPYFVQLREFERRLLHGALVAAGNTDDAAVVLGVTSHYIRARGKLLGGVFEGDPKREPPELAIKAWNATTHGLTTKGTPRKRAPRVKLPKPAAVAEAGHAPQEEP